MKTLQYSHCSSSTFLLIYNFTCLLIYNDLRQTYIRYRVPCWRKRHRFFLCLWRLCHVAVTTLHRRRFHTREQRRPVVEIRARISYTTLVTDNRTIRPHTCPVGRFPCLRHTPARWPPIDPRPRRRSADVRRPQPTRTVVDTHTGTAGGILIRSESNDKRPNTRVLGGV